MICVKGEAVADAKADLKTKTVGRNTACYRDHRPLAVLAGGASKPRDDGVATNYLELVWLLREHRHALGITQGELDERSGFQDQYVSKLEQPEGLYGRRAVNPSFDLWLGGLGVGIKLVPLK